MQYTSHRLAILMLGAMLVAAPAVAQGGQYPQTLHVGDEAPPLAIGEWVKGESIERLGDGETVYVVEFWATWCPPCLFSIPHLTELQEEYKDRNVVVVGISNEDISDVKPFVENQGDAMDYHVAVDDNAKTSRAYVLASGEPTIPKAFLVDAAGKIAWMGHPMHPEMKEKLDELAPEPDADESE
jgi:thiol-disulfide isomerase/thioredoxin